MASPISDRIKNDPIPKNERASFKGQDIAKAVSKGKFARSKYEIEIVEINAIKNGVEVFARAWNKDGTQIGFGKDGSVDIERFRIFNPPILVPDPQGNIVRVTEANPELGTERSESRYREDPQEALIQVIEHNLSVMKNIHADTNIVRGKRGRTTTTVFPEAGSGGTTADAKIAVGNATSWNSVHDASSGVDPDSGFSTINNSAPTIAIQSGYFPDDSQDWRIVRAAFTLDTSGIGTDTIDSATMSLYYTGSNTDVNDGFDWVGIVSSTPASNNNIVNGDYDQIGDAIDNPTEMHDTGERFDTFGATTGEYKNWTFNATGVAQINTSGVTPLGARTGHDILDDDPSNDGEGRRIIGFSAADEIGTTQDPKLVVEHSASVIEKNLTESVTTSDNVLLETAKNLAESITTGVAIVTSLIFEKLFTESVTATITASAKVTVKYVSESVTVTANMVRDLTRSITESVTVNDTITKAFTYVKNLTESVATNVVSTAKITAKVITESVTVNAIIDSTQNLTRAFTESVTATVSMVRSTAKTLSDSVTSSATLAKVLTATRSFTESVNVRARLYGLLNGVNMLWNNKYVAKAGTWINKYLGNK